MEQRTGIAIVTGASSGMGASFARALARISAGTLSIPGIPGFDELWLIARRQDRLRKVVDELTQVHPMLQIRCFAYDLTEPGKLLTIRHEIIEAKKQVSLLINNAGFGTYGTFISTGRDLLLKELDLNCRVPTELISITSSFMKSGAIIINIASLAAFAPLGGFALYAATKAFMLNLSVGLATELREQGIFVHAFCPGPVKTEFAEVASGGLRKEVKGGWDPDKAVLYCIKQAGKGKIISVPRFRWRFRMFLAWLFGPIASAFFAWKFMRRPSVRDVHDDTLLSR
ncbi:MAG TPA: SDR family NAD(P)-dependent oxidoreductase [Spirochaetales bacterium]|nr:SDR family NAD(P)-dependent oxidoreductase [Spirochaetales bacterium]HPD80311.1 SDR family NAD(P)-dependent oxidoreductase [Spirochaetales bacterium]